MATAIDVIDATGKKTGSVTLPADLFDVETNIPLMHQVVVAQLAAARQGTHKVKGRGEVSGAGRKPFKQKGTGRARQGSIRAPQHRGGGIVHGPVPRDYSQRTPKKMIRQALLGALSDRARAERVHVVSTLGLGDTPSTKSAAAVLSQTAPGRNVLVVIGREDVVGQKSIRNIAGVHAIHPDQLNAYDVLDSDDIIFTAQALDQFVAGNGTEKKGA
jgi:large subunit ribosomal protein L4